MKLTPMRYKNYTWPHNPETYKISFVRRVAAHGVPFGTYILQETGRDCRVMEGEGVFSGEGAYAEFKKLAAVFYEGGAGTLVHPVWQTTSAYFVALALMQEPREDYVRYRFTFWEALGEEPSVMTEVTRSDAAQDTVKVKSERRCHTVAQGDTLWGIARRYGVTLGELIAANPQIKNPNRIYIGEEVYLP